MSASATEAVAIARAILDGKAGHLPPIDLLNIGVSTMAPLPDALGALLEKASLGCVAHLEEINLVGEADDDRLRRVLDLCESLSPRWIQEDLGIWVWKGGALGAHMIPPILDEKSLDEATRIVGRILSASRWPFLAENPPFYCVLGDMDLLSFMAKLARRTGCGLVLDIGHFIGYCACSAKEPLSYLDTFTGWDDVVEVHLAGYTMTDTSRGTLWEDAHEVDIPPLGLTVLDRVLAFARNVKAITIEVEGARLDVLRSNVIRVAERVQAVAAHA
ncbi:DUF692 family protein [Pendulispora brunnea]|uniref:DUF692 family protein n=1 Tax=Pendulispora brunnea TaxID=2905690 RepID=A0ABZ2K3J5_9BACT